MSVFTAAEIEYLGGQPLGRLATVGSDGQPHVVPRVAFVVDDLASVRPWVVRGIEIRGEAEVVRTEALRPGFDDSMFRITLLRIVSWGLEKDGRRARSVASRDTSG
jgi:pyridoxamine 5'-phosphate oxidase family protein